MGTTSATPTIGIVVPCYNEAEVLAETNGRLSELLKGLKTSGIIAQESFICYVDDGSRDKSWEMIMALAEAQPWIQGIKLSSNRGHQNALLCGLLHAPGDALVSIDADLQDDVTIISEMIGKYIEGVDIVYGVRRRRNSDSLLKRLSAQGYYRLLACLGVKVIYNHADFRLMSRRAIEALREYKECHLYLRGIIPLLGYRTSRIEFDRAPRFAGDSKYTLRKMLALAWDGVVSFSAFPLRLITYFGLIVSLASLCLAGWAVSIRLFTDQAVPGWASTVVPIYFLGGVQLLSLGILGEFVAKIYEGVKQRPRFHIEEVCGSFRDMRS